MDDTAFPACPCLVGPATPPIAEDGGVFEVAARHSGSALRNPLKAMNRGRKLDALREL